MNFSVKIRKNKRIETSSFIRAMDQFTNILARNSLFGAFEVFGNDVDRNHMIQTAEIVRYCTIDVMNTYPGAFIIKIWKISEENGIYSAEVKVDDDNDKMNILYAATSAEFVPRLLVKKGNLVVPNADNPDMLAERVITLDYVVNDPELFAQLKGIQVASDKQEGLVHTNALRSDIQLEEVGELV